MDFKFQSCFMYANRPIRRPARSLGFPVLEIIWFNEVKGKQFKFRSDKFTVKMAFTDNNFSISHH